MSLFGGQGDSFAYKSNIAKQINVNAKHKAFHVILDIIKVNFV